jgi:hypothetical protein
VPSGHCNREWLQMATRHSEVERNRYGAILIKDRAASGEVSNRPLDPSGCAQTHCRNRPPMAASGKRVPPSTCTGQKDGVPPQVLISHLARHAVVLTSKDNQLYNKTMTWREDCLLYCI